MGSYHGIENRPVVVDVDEICHPVAVLHMDEERCVGRQGHDLGIALQTGHEACFCNCGLPCHMLSLNRDFDFEMSAEGCSEIL